MLDICLLGTGGMMPLPNRWLTSLMTRYNGGSLLIDCGEGTQIAIQKQGWSFKQIDTICFTHFHADHISGLIGVLNTFNVDRVIGPDYEDDTEIYDSFMETLDKRGLGVEHPGVGERLSLGTADIMVLGPLKTYEAPNNNSIVLKISYGEDTFLLPGDAEGDAEKDMLSADLDLSADVLVLGHHGSRTSTSRDFLWAVLPDQVIVSCGRGNPARASCCSVCCMVSGRSRKGANPVNPYSRTASVRSVTRIPTPACRLKDSISSRSRSLFCPASFRPSSKSTIAAWLFAPGC